MALERPQFVHFGFYQIDACWWRLPKERQEQDRQAFIAFIEQEAKQFFVQVYSLVGIRAEVDFLIWKASHNIEDFESFALALKETALGKYLSAPHAYLSMTRRSQYVQEHTHEGQENSRLTIRPPEAKYLCIYPFTKTDAWYQLPFEQRQEMMKEHFAIGHKYPDIKIHTTYSFGLDDQEFVLAFDTDHLEQFLALVMELRESTARPYTLRDTPIFTCLRTPVREFLVAKTKQTIATNEPLTKELAARLAS